MITKDTIRQIIAEKLEADGCFEVEISVSSQNEIAVVVDSVQGISIDYCVELTRLIESALDRDAEDFALEVSSAGIGCVLQVPRQFLKNLGHEVEVTFANGSHKKGVLVVADDEHFEVDIDEKVQVEGQKKKQTVRTRCSYTYAEVKQVKDIISFK